MGTRLCAAISQNESLSEIEMDLLRLKQKELESVIRKQHEEIYRLKEDNLFFKLRLLLLENLVYNNMSINNTKGSSSRDSEQSTVPTKNKSSFIINIDNSRCGDNAQSDQSTVPT